MEADTPSDHDPDEERRNPKNTNLTSEFNYKLKPQNHGYHRETQIVGLKKLIFNASELH